MRTWMRLIPAILLATPFTGPAYAADAETDKKIDQLQKDVAQLRKDLESLREEVKNSNARGAKVSEDLQEIKTILRDLANRQAALTRQAAYGPPGIPSGATPSPTATITVQNTYSAAATVRINGQSYRVAPGQTMPILGVPTGTFQYSVDVDGYGTVEPLRTDTLQPAGYRITIYPRMP
jgi:TolA-binding protein